MKKTALWGLVLIGLTQWFARLGWHAHYLSTVDMLATTALTVLALALLWGAYVWSIVTRWPDTPKAKNIQWALIFSSISAMLALGAWDAIHDPWREAVATLMIGSIIFCLIWYSYYRNVKAMWVADD